MSFQNIQSEDTFFQSNETYIITKSNTKYKIQINPFKKVPLVKTTVLAFISTPKEVLIPLILPFSIISPETISW